MDTHYAELSDMINNWRIKYPVSNIRMPQLEEIESLQKIHGPLVINEVFKSYKQQIDIEDLTYSGVSWKDAYFQVMGIRVDD